MRTRSDRAARPASWFVAVIYGALVALAMTYALSYIITRLGMGIVSGPRSAVSEPEVLLRTGLNLYASQHITLIGEGTVHSAVAAAEPLRVSSSLTLPISIWAILPMVALMMAGYSAAHTRLVAGRWAMVTPAVVGGLLYALALAGLSHLFGAKIEGFLMPEIGGMQANPPEVAFRPDARSALLFGGLFGVVFSYLGALAAAREQASDDDEPGRLWVSAKAAMVVVLTLQLVIAAAAGVWFVATSDGEPEDDAGRARVIEMLPAAAGIVYAMANGADAVVGVESSLKSGTSVSRASHARASLYRGIEIEQLGRKLHKPIPSSVSVCVAVLACAAVLLSGWLAVRWGARGGSVPVGLRIATVHTAYLAILVELCSLRLIHGDPAMVSTMSVRPMLGTWLLLSYAAVSVLAMVGAHIASFRVVQTP